MIMMTPMNSSDIRQAFFDYFTKHGHQQVASSPLVPGNDPTLLFTNAGMVQFKETFLGLEPRAYTRAVTAQTCVRAGGKHNDLENVGYTARHHTFFEMLGNFSFGDYFKREAIAYAWEFLTQVLHLPQERLWVTVYKDDQEAADIWLKEVGVSPDRFSRLGDADNFWSMGDTGPCGPCTEIFYDHGPEIAGGPPGSPDADGDRYIEVWNLVFMQFNRDNQGQLHPLPKPSVDTGMGLERITAVVQGVHTNYEIDSFQHLIKAIAKKTNGIHHHASLNVIADHIRACSFLIAEGVVPSNEGRGYVLRRIIRRAVRHGHRLGLPTPFFCDLVAPLCEVMGTAYPALVKQQAVIERLLAQEENQFARTLEQGLTLLQEHMKTLDSATIPGEMAFKLYDTYGFPLDLTADIAREHNLAIDNEGFERCMQEQRLKSQSASHFSVDYSTPAQLTESTVFHGYESDTLQTKVLTLLVEGKERDELTVGDNAVIVLSETPFYAESGGQVGDRGQLVAEKGTFRVDDTKKIGNAIAHYGKLIKGTMRLGQAVHAEIDSVRRNAIRLNHTATHLLHAALKTIVGEHVQQKGSLVDAQRARFDFSQLQQVETLVNDHIRQNHKVVTTLMSVDEAKNAGALALFGEKYSEEVRVLTMDHFSKELCGGTHAKRTGDIGLFKIVSEYGVASGVRRIEMITGASALEWVEQQFGMLGELASLLKTTPSHLSEKLSQTLTDMKQQEKELAQIKQKLASQSGNEMLSEVKKVGDINLLVKQLKEIDAQGLRTLLDQLKSSIPSAVIVLVSVSEEKMSVVAGVSKEILGKVPSAGLFVKHLCGKGGGRDDLAQGGGAVPADLAKKLADIATMLSPDHSN